MLTVFGNQGRYCDGVPRRKFLKIGGLTMPDILRAHSQVESGLPHKAVIMVFLPGGPSCQDMFDIKTEALVEYAVSSGRFRPMYPVSRFASIYRRWPL